MMERKKSSMQNIKSDADPSNQHELFLHWKCTKYLIAVGTMLWTECQCALFCQGLFTCTELIQP